MSRKTLMKKKAIIIANQDGKLTGVSKDIEHIQEFLKSIPGGAWNTDEIELHINPSLSSLRLSLAIDKLSKYDYMMVFFTGHGGHKRQETYVQINNDKQLIAQSELENLCNKQINIYDCCRSEIEELKEARASLSMDSYSFSDSLRLSRIQARQIYNNQIEKAKPQQLILYSCSLNEYSQDESYGALYLTNLLRDANNFTNCEYYEKRFKVALESHLNAVERVKKDNRDKNNPQNPDYRATRFPNIEHHLILSINPESYVHR
jgi:hypothetical protein